MITNELKVLSIAAGSIFSLLVLLLAYLIIRKIFETRERKNINLLKEKLSVPLLDFITEEKVARDLRIDSELKLKAAEEVLSSYSAILEGEQEKKNLYTFADLNFRAYYLKSLRSRRWSKRMNALYHIEDFGLLGLQEEILKIARNPRSSQDERVHALRILASFQFSQLYSLLEEQLPLSDYEYRNILMRLQQKEFEPFILSFHHCHDALQWGILDCIAIYRETSYTTFVEKVFAVYEGEVRLRAVKALAAIGYVKDAKPYLPLSQSEQWQERMVAAKLFGALKEPSLLPILVELLHDSSWYVRSQAAQSIRMQPNGIEALRNVLETSNDSFAKDMAREWMNH
ncbi:HEAT repeat domain-containing protein [Cytobacillus depressus]|uniref:HEAT repeat domain-containing protein n=1 Tax=Cytobacillus depressus TaxID=1602942 RepID=A0A6L3V811_9BACI|nr:HEAT repeat domain-containing protein [Cytobacillus depressus]KAB2336495.1 HEAT repeat domain-containing protein [Cytobacillus depressus]